MRNVWAVDGDKLPLTLMSYEELMRIEEASMRLNSDIRGEISKRVPDKHWEISGNSIKCDKIDFKLPKYYRDSDIGCVATCHNFRTLHIKDDNDDGDLFLLWAKCIVASRFNLEHLTIDYSLKDSIAPKYNEAFNLDKLWFEKLATLVVTGYTKAIDINNICPYSTLKSLGLANCKLPAFKLAGERPLDLLQIDATTMNQQTTGLISQTAAFAAVHQEWTNPPQDLDFSSNFIWFKELSVNSDDRYFHYLFSPYVIGGNDPDNLAAVLDKLKNVQKSVIDHFHIYIKRDLQTPAQSLTVTKLLGASANHLTIITSNEDFYDSLLDDHIDEKLHKIVEFVLVDDNDRPKKFIYIDFGQNFAYATSDHYELITSMQPTSLWLKYENYMSVAEQTDLMAELHADKMQFLKIGVDFSQSATNFHPNTFSLPLHLYNNDVEIISRNKTPDLNCVEIIFKKARILDGRFSVTLKQIPTGGDFYRILFEQAMAAVNIAKLILSIDDTSCKYLSISGKVAPFFQYIHDNWQILKVKLNKWKILSHLRVEVDQRVVDDKVVELLSPVLAYPSLKYIVLIFAQQTQIVNRNIEELLQQLNSSRPNMSAWIQLKQSMQDRFKRIYVLADSSETPAGDEMEQLRYFIDNPWSLLAESDAEVAAKKKANHKLQSLSGFSY